MKQNMQNQTKSELSTDDEKSKYSSNPNDILKPAKNFYEKLYTKETSSKTATPEIISTISTSVSNRKKIWNKQFQHCEANNFLEKVIKFINSQTNIKSPGNDSLTAKFYIYLSNELSLIL